jgi:hypothetical protein
MKAAFLHHKLSLPALAGKEIIIGKKGSVLHGAAPVYTIH